MICGLIVARCSVMKVKDNRLKYASMYVPQLLCHSSAPISGGDDVMRHLHCPHCYS